jgi:prepilin-type N-terminal cleavage/methylation domain-containing protein
MPRGALSETGFTLIELLVVVAIIGVLAAIAIPQYAAYKKGTIDAKMKSDLHNAAQAMEAYYGSNDNSYAGADVDTLKAFGYRQSDGVTLDVSGNVTTFTVTASATGGNVGSIAFDATTGKMQ